MLLFVYGPYMNPKFLQEKGINIKHSERAVLKDYEICFSTKTNDYKIAMIDIKESKGKRVEGVLYDISDSVMDIFDNHEMIRYGKHDRIMVNLMTETNEAKKAYTFISPIKEGNYVPSAEYLNVIIEGAKLHNLPDEYIEFIRNFNKSNG